MIPIRCYTCNSVIAQKWNKYQSVLKATRDTKQALNDADVNRMCCRIMILGYVDLTPSSLQYPQRDITLQKSIAVLHREQQEESTWSCD